MNYSNILVCLDNILYIFSSKPFIFLITTQKHIKKTLIWSSLCILYNNFGSLLCASNLFHPHLCGKFYILKWYNCYWNILLVWQFWVRSNIEKHILSTYIFRILFFFFQLLLSWKLSKCNLKFSKEITWKWMIFFYFCFLSTFCKFGKF